MIVRKQPSESTVKLPKWHLPPPLLAAVAFGIQSVLARGRGSSRTSRIAGAIVAGSSIFLAGRAVLEFRRCNTTINPDTLATTKLVTTGPNRWTRNPMYLGTAGVLAANAVYRRSWLGMLPVLGYAVVMDRMQIPAEEAVLQDRFGATYEQYQKATPRWFKMLCF